MFQSCHSMNRLFTNHLEVYLLNAKKIFTVAVACYEDKCHKFYDGTKFVII